MCETNSREVTKQLRVVLTERPLVPRSTGGAGRRFDICASSCYVDVNKQRRVPALSLTAVGAHAAAPAVFAVTSPPLSPLSRYPVSSTL